MLLWSLLAFFLSVMIRIVGLHLALLVHFQYWDDWMSAYSTRISMAHDKVAIIAPAFTPWISHNPFILLCLSHNCDGVVPTKSFAVSEGAIRVFRKITRIYHGSHHVVFDKLALDGLTVAWWQLFKPRYLIFFGFLYGFFVALKWLTRDRAIRIFFRGN